MPLSLQYLLGAVKKKEVNINKSLWIATTASSLSFFILGFFGALSFQFPVNSNILSVINGSSYANMFTKVLVYLFPLMILATTIPVFSIIVRYNLLQSKIRKSVANLLAVVLPWIVVIPFLTGNGLNNILNWGTLLFSSIANFVIPFAIYIQACHFKKDPSRLNQNQKEILLSLKLGSAEMKNCNSIYYDNGYKALPDKYINSRSLSIVSIVLLSSLVLSVIGLNIYSSVV